MLRTADRYTCRMTERDVSAGGQIPPSGGAARGKVAEPVGGDRRQRRVVTYFELSDLQDAGTLVRDIRRQRGRRY